MIIALTAAASVANADCGPYGNAPARTYPRKYPVSAVPDCGTAGGTTLGVSTDDAWADSDGTPRYACLWKPGTISALRPLPLLVYLHPSKSSADRVVDTNLLDYLGTLDLSDDPARPGFILLAPQGRFIHHYYGLNPYSVSLENNAIGPGWDNWYRQLNPAGAVIVQGSIYKENVDAATIDHFIQQVVDTNRVDTNRIYVSGWSNGGAMAYLYALNRPNIAAVATYSAVNPYASFDDTCKQTPVAGIPGDISEIHMNAPSTPITHVHNYCDIWGECPNMLNLHQLLAAQGTPVTDLIINSEQKAMIPQGACNTSCGTNPNGAALNTLGMPNHLRWPTEWTETMGLFLKNHPLDAR